MRQINCKKIELASALNMRLLYCKNCEVITLEIGAISLNLSPKTIWRIANMMMKASLKLENIQAANLQQKPYEQRHLMH